MGVSLAIVFSGGPQARRHCRSLETISKRLLTSRDTWHGLAELTVEASRPRLCVSIHSSSMVTPEGGCATVLRKFLNNEETFPAARRARGNFSGVVVSALPSPARAPYNPCPIVAKFF